MSDSKSPNVGIPKAVKVGAGVFGGLWLLNIVFVIAGLVLVFGVFVPFVIRTIDANTHYEDYKLEIMVVADDIGPFTRAGYKNKKWDDEEATMKALGFPENTKLDDLSKVTIRKTARDWRKHSPAPTDVN